MTQLALGSRRWLNPLLGLSLFCGSLLGGTVTGSTAALAAPAASAVPTAPAASAIPTAPAASAVPTAPAASADSAVSAEGPPAPLGRTLEIWVQQTLPQFLQWQVGSAALWQWLGLLLIVALSLVVGRLVAGVVLRLAVRTTALTQWQWDDQMATHARGPLVVAATVVGAALLLPLLFFPDSTQDTLLNICQVLIILALGWFVVRLTDVVGEAVFRSCQERQDDMGQAMVPVARKILKVFIVFIVIIVALQNMGMNVGGLVAGLGIGGLAVALAAKNTLENVFGSIVISFDRPFKVGDFVLVGDHLGTVEDLGLRSTRIRTLNRTVVTIPNAQMADSRVENYTKRDRMRLVVPIGVQYDTSWDQVRLMVDELKRYLLGHPKVWQESFSVRFAGFGDYSLTIELICYVDTPDWNEFTGVREGMLLEIGAIVARAGAQFAYPSQTVYVGKDQPTAKKAATQASDVVQQRQEAGELCLPDIPDSVRQAIQGPPPSAP